MNNLHHCACRFASIGGPPEKYCAHHATQRDELEKARDEIRQLRKLVDVAEDVRDVDLTLFCCDKETWSAFCAALDEIQPSTPASDSRERDAACLDAGCDIDPSIPHRPHCDNAPAVDSQWTVEPPTEPRWYWWRQGDRIEPCMICSDGDELFASFIGDPIRHYQHGWQPDWLWADIRFPAATRHEGSE